MRDDAGVGGFFEDLPVLVFVLLGVSTLVLTSFFASQRVFEQNEADRMRSIAEDIADSVVSQLSFGDAVGGLPTIASMRGMNLSTPAKSVDSQKGYCVSVAMLYPRLEWLCSATNGPAIIPGRTGFARCLLNAICDDGSVAVVEVKALAW